MTLTRNPWWLAAGLIMLGGLLTAAAAIVRWLPSPCPAARVAELEALAAIAPP